MTKLFEKYFNIFLFTIFIFVGLILYKDYGISIDEKINRYNGLVNLKYIFDFFSISLGNINLFNNVESLNNYTDRYYGAVLEIFNILLIEIFLNKSELNEIFFLRHLINHLIFITSLFFFYLLCQEIFKNKILSTFCVLFLYSTPRIFANSFYNGKDLVFLSFFIIMIYFAFRCLKNLNYRNLFYFSLTFALASNSRIIVIYVPLLLIFFIHYEALVKKYNFSYIFKYTFFLILLSSFFLFLTYPYLWENPFQNFFQILKLFSKFDRWDLKLFYLGEFYEAKKLPWHYLFVLIFVTTPIIVIISCIGGLLLILQLIINRFFYMIEKAGVNDIWKDYKEKLIFFVFLIIFIPIFSIFIFDSIIYNGWRHFYFIYPFLVIHCIYFINYLIKKYFKKNYDYLIILSLSIVFFINIFSLYYYHPHQNVFFNYSVKNKANNLFEKDYWGLVNYQSLKKIHNINKDKIYIGVASFTDLNLSKKIFDSKIRENFIVVGQMYDKADFIINNFQYETNPRYNKKYTIPKNFTKIFEIKRGNIIISEIYKKN